MSRSMTIRKSPARSTTRSITLIIGVFVLSALLTACDGGLFGTDSGSDNDMDATVGAAESPALS